MRGDVDHHIEFFTQRVGFIDAELQIFVIEFVVTHAQRVARLAGINGIGAIGESVTHILQRSRRGEEFWFKHGVLVLMTGQIRRTWCGELGSVPTLRAGIVAPRRRGVNIRWVSFSMANLFAILNLGSAHTDSTHNAWWDRRYGVSRVAA